MEIEQRFHAVRLLACMALSLSGPTAAADCNRNGVGDAADIAVASSADCNRNGVPDECEVSPLRFVLEEQTYPTHRPPIRLLSADVDGDGDTDLVSLGRRLTRSFFSILLNEDGSFALEDALTAETRIFFALTEDLDGDGDVDLVTTSSDTVLVFRNQRDKGDGALFAKPESYPLELDTRFLATGDVDGDGAADVLTANDKDNSFSLLRNQGNGTLAAPRTFEGLDQPASVVVRDVDGDGDLDVVTLNAGSRDVSVHANDGGGSFAQSVAYPLDGERPDTLFADDLDGDGDMDLLATTALSVATLRNKGDGSFEDAALYRGSGAAPILADFDGDGDLDLTLAITARGLRLRLNDGAGRFGVTLESSPGTVPTRASPGDFDGDGDVDLAVDREDGIGILWGDESKSLLIDTETLKLPCDRDRLGGTCRPHAGAVADLDGDGALDIVGVITHPAGLIVARNDGEGNFTFLENHAFPTSRAFTLAVGDLNGDGSPDVITANNQRNADTFIHTNQGDATFVSRPTAEVSRGAVHVLLNDMDGDAALDIVAADEIGASVVVLFGEGDGSFNEANRGDHQVGPSPQGVEAADLDGDGALDIVAAVGGSAAVAVLLNTGGRSFSDREDYRLAASPRYVRAADVDRDGDLDIVAPTGAFVTFADAPNRDQLAETENAVAVLLNSGAGEFPEVRTSPIPEEAYSLEVTDFDGDGILDVATGNWRTNSVSILTGQGDATFETAAEVIVQDEPRFVFPGDMDGDGDVDLVTIERSGNSYSVIFNRSGRQGADYLETLCVPLDFHKLSTSSAGLRRLLRYLAPARNGDTLLPIVFQNTRRFALAEDFLTSLFPERFPTLSSKEYAALVGHRETRDYYAGSITRIRTPEGTVFGFDVLTAADEPAELLTLEQTREVFEQLRSAFALRPLVYLPSGEGAREVAASWDDPGFGVLIEDEEEMPTEPEGNPTFTLEIPANTVACGVFLQGREPRLEYERKSRIRFKEGVYSLPTESASFTAELLKEVLVGSERVEAVARGPGRFDVFRIAVGDGTTVYRFEYEQEFSTAEGKIYEVTLAHPLRFRGRGETALDGATRFDEEFFAVPAGRAAWRASRDGEPLIHYGSCTYESLPLFEIRAALEDGTDLVLRERLLEIPDDTGPAALVAAEVTLAEARWRVSEYWELAYTALRHNEGARYWVVIEPPQHIGALKGPPVRAIELQAPRPLEGLGPSASYLGEDFGVLAEVGVASYEKTEVTPADALFSRGDVQVDGNVDIRDGLFLLNYLFQRGESPPCRKGADANDDGRLNLIDAVAIVAVLFGGRDSLPAPFSGCGADPTPDGLSCQVRGSCE